MIKNFHSIFEQNLDSCFLNFFEENLKFIEENYANYYRCSIEHSTPMSPPFNISLIACKRWMKSIMSEKMGVKFREVNFNNGKWTENEIYFPFTMNPPGTPAFGTEAFFRFREWRDYVEFECEEEFWSFETHMEGFSLVEERTLDGKNTTGIVNYQDTSNANAVFFEKGYWRSYVLEMVKYHFPDFKYVEYLSTNKKIRLLKKIDNQYSLGIEYETSAMDRELKNSSHDLPLVFNLVLFEHSLGNNNRLKIIDSVSLGILGNPFFYPPAYKLAGYSAIIKHLIRDEKKASFLDYLDDYVDKVKKHTFFYFHLLSKTSAIYLSYIDRVLKKSIASV